MQARRKKKKKYKKIPIQKEGTSALTRAGAKHFGDTRYSNCVCVLLEITTSQCCARPSGTILIPVYKVEELQENVQNDVDVEKMIATNAARSIDVKVVNSSKCHSHAEWIG